jgi:hypothetical protein
MEMKKILSSKPQIETRYKLLEILYTNRKKGNLIPTEKDINILIALNKLNISKEDVKEFFEFIEATNIVLDDKINLEYKEAIIEIEKLVLV